MERWKRQNLGLKCLQILKVVFYDKLFYSKIMFYQNQTLYLKNSIIKTH